jgi:hypothetical protein
MPHRMLRPLHDANNDNSLPESGISLPLEGLHGDSSFRAQSRLPVFTSILVWILLAVVGWGVVALGFRFL